MNAFKTPKTRGNTKRMSIKHRQAAERIKLLWDYDLLSCQLCYF